MHAVAESIEDAPESQGATPGKRGAIGATQCMGNRCRGIEIDAFQQVRILGCRPQRPAIDGTWQARVLRFGMVGVASIPDRLALGFALDRPPSGGGGEIVGEHVTAFLVAAVSYADRP